MTSQSFCPPLLDQTETMKGYYQIKENRSLCPCGWMVPILEMRRFSCLLRLSFLSFLFDNYIYVLIPWNRSTEQALLTIYWYVTCQVTEFKDVPSSRKLLNVFYATDIIFKFWCNHYAWILISFILSISALDNTSYFNILKKGSARNANKVFIVPNRNIKKSLYCQYG